MTRAATTDVTSFELAADVLGDPDALAVPALADAVVEATGALYNRVVAAAPRTTGETVRNIHQEITGDGAETAGRIFLTGPAIPVATGARPHRIEPTEARVLRFDNGSFARGVDHPGSPPHPFMEQGETDADEEINQALEHAADVVAEALTV